jgi:hypothetical protein
MSKAIPSEVFMTDGTSFFVDSDRYEEVSRFNWTNMGNGTCRKTTDPKKLIHEFLFGKAPPGFEWDHKDMNPRNNCESNLRLATNWQNQANRGKRVGAYSSRFKGVSWNANRRKWVAKISADGRLVFLGYFDVEEDAAKAYDEAAKVYHGEFARLNLV